MNQTIHPCTVAQYRELSGINQTLLKEMRFSESRFRYKQLAPAKPPTRAMLLGLAVEAELFGTGFKFVISQFPEFRTNEAKDWRASMESQGIAVIRQDDAPKINAMVDKVWAHPEAKRWLDHGRSQVGVLADYTAANGSLVQRKGLIDWIADSHLLLVDLKTCRDASPETIIRRDEDEDAAELELSEAGFQRQLWGLRYDVQAAYYVDLWHTVTGECPEFGFIAVENEPPHDVSCFVCDPDVIARGNRDWRRWLDRFAVARDTDNWPGYSTAAEYIRLPRWARSET